MLMRNIRDVGQPWEVSNTYSIQDREGRIVALLPIYKREDALPHGRTGILAASPEMYAALSLARETARVRDMLDNGQEEDALGIARAYGYEGVRGPEALKAMEFYTTVQRDAALRKADKQ
jgi:hypothetical protein